MSRIIFKSLWKTLLKVRTGRPFLSQPPAPSSHPALHHQRFDSACYPRFRPALLALSPAEGREPKGPALLASGFRSPVDSTGVPTPDLGPAEGNGVERERMMPSNSLDNTARPGLSLLAGTACPEPSRRERRERACAACPACPEPTRGKPSRREHSECVSSPSTEFHSPLLLANRGFAELEILPSPCKQRATTPSNRGEIRVVEPLRHEPRGINPSPRLFANRNTAELAIVPSCWKQRTATRSNRHKIAFFSESARMETSRRVFARLGR
jgi:hypothetical protein